MIGTPLDRNIINLLIFLLILWSIFYLVSGFWGKFFLIWGDLIYGILYLKIYYIRLEPK
jgi:ABC-type multidrug transport system fused ATPase/permease subunit